MFTSLRTLACVAAFLPLGAWAQTSAPAAAAPSAGQTLYAKNCLVCHAAGPSFVGTNVLAARFGAENALLVHRELPAPYIEHVVRHGAGSMPGFRRTEITDSELKAVIDYIAQQPKGPQPAPGAKP